jgi:photosynthetic reaction center H subunit
MGTGAITQYVDVAQVVLYVFWVFFAGLVFYLTYESKREGFPLESDRPDGTVKIDAGLLPMPTVKVYRTRHHGDFDSPHLRDFDAPPIPGERIGAASGMPLEPTGDPMAGGIGPGAWTMRSDLADRTAEGEIKIVPLSQAPGFSLYHRDPDPRGMPVVGADGEVGGEVTEVWVDRSEHMVRFLEVRTPSGRQVLLPINFSRVQDDRVSGRKVKVQSILGAQFEGVPQTRSSSQITLLEEEKVMAYYGGGTLFATPERREPLA